MPRLKKGTLLPSREEDQNITLAAHKDGSLISDEMFDSMRPATDVLPQLTSKGRGPQKKPVKKQVTLRIDPDIVDYFRTQGKGWQSKMNDALRGHIERRSRS